MSFDTNTSWGSWKHLQHAVFWSKPTVQWHAGLWGKLCMLLARGISWGLRVRLLFGSLQTAAVPQEGETCNKWLHLLEANQSSSKGSGPAKYVYCSGNAFVLMQIFHWKTLDILKTLRKMGWCLFADVFEPGFECCCPYSLHWVWYCCGCMANHFFYCTDGFCNWCQAHADAVTLVTGPQQATAWLAKVGTHKLWSLEYKNTFVLFLGVKKICDLDWRQEISPKDTFLFSIAAFEGRKMGKVKYCVDCH